MQRGKSRRREGALTSLPGASRASVAAIRTASAAPVSAEDFPLWSELNLPSWRRLSQLICLLLCAFPKEKIRLKWLSNPVAMETPVVVHRQEAASVTSSDEGSHAGDV